MAYESTARCACPKCGKGTGLWRAASRAGWVPLNERLEITGPFEGEGCLELGREVGCGECEWEGTQHDLTVLGWDDEPLRTISPHQMTLADLAVAA